MSRHPLAGAALAGVMLAALAAGCASQPARQSASLELAPVATRSLAPTLRWAPFPHPLGDATARPGQSRAVTYDLRIWRAERGHPIELVYEREGLAEPSHEIEQALEPSRAYVWSARARFEVDGHVRVSEWGAVQAPRLPLLPHPFLPRFRTPPP